MYYQNLSDFEYLTLLKKIHMHTHYAHKTTYGILPTYCPTEFIAPATLFTFTYYKHYVDMRGVGAVCVRYSYAYIYISPVG